MLTQVRDAEQTDVELQLAAYVDKLQDWPITDVERVLSEWPRRSQWWPTWHELEAQLPDLRPVAIEDQRSRRPQQQRQEQGWQPFKTRREWDEHQQCLAKLRDPSVPMIAREALLRMGEAMEARQLPNARAMGWVA